MIGLLGYGLEKADGILKDYFQTLRLSPESIFDLSVDWDSQKIGTHSDSLLVDSPHEF